MGFFQLLNLRIKTFIATIPRFHICSSETLESKALIPNVMKLAHKIEENIDHNLEIIPFEGET